MRSPNWICLPASTWKSKSSRDMNGLIGRKLGMTRVFDAAGTHVPVTVIEAGPCAVISVAEGRAELGFGAKKANRTPKALAGHVKKGGVEIAPRLIRRFTVTGEAPAAGSAVTVAIFAAGDRVKVRGVSKGRGFQGVVHRHHFGGGPETHGNTRHRKPGSIAPGTDPSRIIKGKRMPGHMGARNFTELGLRVVKVDAERNLLFVRGSVPGPMNGLLTVRKQGGPSPPLAARRHRVWPAPAELPARHPEERAPAGQEVGAQRPGARGRAVRRGRARIREAEDQDVGGAARQAGRGGEEGAGGDGRRRARAQRVSVGPQPPEGAGDAVRRRHRVRDPVGGCGGRGAAGAGSRGREAGGRGCLSSTI